ncbi:MAG: chaperonin GroEL [Verrucomicrobia bacterium]|nr:chaperonin GroEL [Verrucomicrobiota bacterium]
MVCNDGVTIAKEFELREPTENLGAQMIRQAAERTSEKVGDGTSTSTVLAYAIFADGVRNVTAGASAVELKKGLDRGLAVAIECLRNLSRKLETRKEKAQVAALSAHNDVKMGEIVADAMEKVGADGAITVEESRTTDTTLDVVEGLKFEHGYISPYFVTDTQKMEVVLENPLILLTEKKISNMLDLLPLLEQIAKAGRQLLVVADDLDGEALTTLVVNKLRGVLTAAAAKAPGFGDRRKALLQDLAILTGGTVVSDELGTTLDKIKLEGLGSARRVVLNKDSTVVVGGAGSAPMIAARCEELRRQIEDTTSAYDREKLTERLAKLKGGVAVIRVGAPSEVEMQSRKDAFEDAISATKAAMSEGIVPGGGLALIRTIEAVEVEAQKCEGDERTGVLILKRAMEAPSRQIAENSSADSGVVINRMRGGTGNLGFDAARGEFVDLMEAGIIDPTKVVRVALENAVSVAGILLFTEATMTEIPEPHKRHKLETETEFEP